MREYTKAEEQAIKTAYNRLEQIASYHTGQTAKLQEWLRVEKRECKQTTFAKAQILKQWKDGYDNPLRAAIHLIHIRPSCLLPLLWGIEFNLNHGGKRDTIWTTEGKPEKTIFDGFMNTELPAAIKAQEDYIKRGHVS
jgi:hypothetical protein